MFSFFQNSSRRFLARSRVSDAVEARLDMADTERTSSSPSPTPPPALTIEPLPKASGGGRSTLRGGVYDLASSPKPTLEAGLTGLISLFSFGGVVDPFRTPCEGFFFLENDSDFSKLSFKMFVVISRWCRRELLVSRSSGVGDRPRSRTISSSSEVASVPKLIRLSSDRLGKCSRSSAHASRLRGGEALLGRGRGMKSRSLFLSSAGDEDLCDSDRELARSACSLLIASRFSREKCVPRACWE